MICIVTYSPLNLDYALSLGASFPSTDLSELSELKAYLSHYAKREIFIGVEFEKVS